MLTRFKTSLTSPRGIGKFKNDSIIKSLLCLLLLSILVIIPTLIVAVKSKGVSESTVLAIRRMLVENKEEAPNGGISNGKLTFEEKKGFGIGEVVIVFSDEELSMLALAKDGYRYVAKMKEQGVDVYYLSTMIKGFTYEELGIVNLDFKFISENDDEGFRLLENAYVKIVNETKGVWATMTIITGILTTFLGVLLIALFFAFMGKTMKNIPYKQLLNYAIYSLGIAMIFILFANLYNVAFLTAIGGIVSLFYLVIALRNDELITKEE